MAGMGSSAHCCRALDAWRAARRTSAPTAPEDAATPIEAPEDGESVTSSHSVPPMVALEPVGVTAHRRPSLPSSCHCHTSAPAVETAEPATARHLPVWRFIRRWEPSARTSMAHACERA